MKKAYKVLDGKPEGRRVLLESQSLVTTGMEGRIILK
jgi:hypothetical protein